MKAYIFPGQGSQYPGMGKDLYEKSARARDLFEKANQLLGFRISDLMFEGSIEELRQTRVTQPAIYLHSVILCRVLPDFNPAMVAGHSLGEFSALTAGGAITFEDGLILVYKRAMAMQKACESKSSAMAAIVGLEDAEVEAICKSVPDTVVPANYNCPGQVVISGTTTGIETACRLATEKGAKRAIRLLVGGAFHSPLMDPARVELASAIESTRFQQPVCPVYQNVSGLPATAPEMIKQNLVKQLSHPVLWTLSIQNMLRDGAREFIETGPGKVLQGLVAKIDKTVAISGLESCPDC